MRASSRSGPRKNEARGIMEEILNASGYDTANGQVRLLREDVTLYSVFYDDPPSQIGSFDYKTRTLYVLGDSELIVMGRPLPRLRKTEAETWEIIRD